MKRFLYLAVVFFCISLTLVACSKDDDTVEGYNGDVKVVNVPSLISKTGGTAKVTVQSSSQPTATTTASWLTVETGTRTQLGNTSVKLTAQPNPDTSDRTAEIKVIAGNQTKTFTVTQTAKDGLLVEQTTYEVDADGGIVTVAMKTNVDGTVNSNVSWVTLLEKTRANMADGIIQLNVEENISVERTASVTLTYGDVVETITINQQGVTSSITATAADIAKLMYPGWNLGNTLEACDASKLFNNNGGTASETGWQPTKTTKEVIDAVKAAGFKSVRIPCSWICGHVSGGTEADPQIDAAWMARVKQIVDYCVEDGLYVVLNDHWDGGWIEVQGFTGSTSSFRAMTDDEVNAKIVTLKSLWTRIAEAFKGYDEHVIFAGLNEPFQEYNLFSTRHEALTPILMKYNKAFVEAVRATGGNNANRILVVQGPSVNIASTVSYMPASSLPEEAGKLMVEVHFYDPGQFCGTFDASGDKAFYYWGSGNSGADHNASWGDEAYMQGQFSNLKTAFTSKGYPVIIGEYAGLQRTLTGGDQAKHDASVKKFYQCVNEYATNNGIVAFAWDTNDVAGLGKESGSSTIIGRSAKAVVGQNAMDGILAGVAAGQWMK